MVEVTPFYGADLSAATLHTPIEQIVFSNLQIYFILSVFFQRDNQQTILFLTNGSF